MKKHLERIHSPQLGRGVSLWSYGHFGPPLLVFPTAAGFAHEWEAQGMVEALAPLLDAGKLKLYCPESNVAEAWTRRDNDAEWRIGRHVAYERFVVETLVPKIRVEIVVDEADADAVVSAIATAAQTGRIGDGKVWVVPIESVVRVRTGDRDRAAI